MMLEYPMKIRSLVIYTLVLLYGSLLAQIPKSGDIGDIERETWTADDSLYIITGDIKVFDLIIEPGVIIQFDRNHKFDVEGVLQAEGFYSDSIYFQPEPGNTAGWEGIKFKSGAVSSSLKYCRIEGASKEGINIDQARPEISNCRIVDNEENGVFLKSTTIQLQHCIISNNTLSGIETDAAELTILNSIISGNVESGILSTHNDDIIVLTNVVIADNQDRGVDCPNGKLTIRNSIIYDNAVQINSQDGNTDVTYSDIVIQGDTLFPGIGNINRDPDFLNRSNYPLSTQSLCIDAGDSSIIYEDRYFPPSMGTSRNDMGAYGGPQAFGWYPPLYINPQIFDFNRVTQDSSQSTVLNILNYRDTGISILETLFENDDSSVFSRYLNNFFVAVSDSVELTVTFEPDSEKVYTSDLILQTQSHGTVSLPLSGEGVLPHINIPLSELNFGPVQLGENSHLELLIMNLGGDTLHVQVTPPSLSNFTLDKSQFAINPDMATETITVTFTPDSPITYQDSLLIVSNDRDSPKIKVSLSGLGLGPVIELDQQTLDFDSVTVLSDSILFLNIRNNGNDTLRINNLTIEPSNSGFAFTDAPITFPLLVEPGSSMNLSIGFSPLERGPMSAQVSIYSNDPFQNMLTVDLSGTGLAPLLLLSSSEIQFDSVSLTSDSTINLTVFNLGNDLLQIDSLLISPSDDVFKMTDTTISFPYTMETETNVTFPIRFEPVERGITNAQITLISNDPFQDTVLIDLSGEGVAAGLNLSTYMLSFGSVPIDSDSVQNLIIYNTIETGLTVDSIVIDPRNTVFEFADTTVIFPRVIDAEDSLIFPVRFKPTQPDSVSADLLIFSDDPFQKEVSVKLSGRGIDSSPKPSIVLSSTILEFNEVDTNSYSQMNLYIYNIGNADLIIPEDSIYITDSPDNAFSIINISEEIRIEPQDSLDITIRFNPSSLGPVQSTLQIKSNDPQNPVMIVALSGTGADFGWVPEIKLSSDVLEFNQVDTSSFSQQILYISNIGYTNLKIPEDSIYISESVHNAFLIMNVSGDISIDPHDSLDIIIRFQPSEFGPVQDTLFIKSNDPLNPLMFVLLSGIGIGNGSATISFDPANSTNPLINRQTATISFEITSFIPTDSATVFARKGGETTFTAFSLQNQGTTSVWSTEIDSNLITERGVEYYVQVNQNHTFSLYPQEGESQPIAVSVQIPYLAFPEKIPGKTYQMISIPFSTPDQNLSDLFLDNLGSYNNSNYRIFECTNGSDYSEIGEMNKPLPPGKSVWLISKEPVELDINNGESVLTDHEYTIELQQGWNMISTPFAFPVSWVDLGASPALRHYDGSDWPFATIMEPFKGYAVNVPQDTVISIPANEAVFAKSLPKPAHPEFADNWLIQISAESGDIKDQFNYVGTLNSATSGIDRFDHPEPPPIGDYISLYLVSPENDGHFSTDYREPDAEGYTFEIELRSNISGHKYIQIIPKNLPKSYDWLVIASETMVNLGKEPIRTSLNQVSYKLIVGTSDYIDENLEDYKTVPKVFKLAQNYPNPFNPSTMITYQLPISSEVGLSIYNILGQKVITLVSDKQEAGYYKIEWKGLNQSNQLVSSGIYFLQLKTKHYIQTIKMILQR